MIYHTTYSGAKIECYDNQKKQRRLMRDRRRKYRAVPLHYARSRTSALLLPSCSGKDTKNICNYRKEKC